MVQEFTQIESFLVMLKEYELENPFYSEAFFSNYFKQYPNKKYVFLLVSENKKNIGLVPLELVREIPGLKVYDFIAHRKANYLGYICKPEDVINVHQEIKRYFHRLKNATKIEYYDINSESLMYKCLSGDQDITNEIELYECPVVVLCANFDEFFIQQVKEGKKRTEIRKFVKKLNAIGKLQLVNIKNKETYATNEKYIHQIFAIHKERFDGVYTPSHFSDISLREYYTSLIKDTVLSETGYLSLLVLDNTVISFIYCLRNKSCLIDWIPAFDPAFTKYNLGTAHYYLLFQKLCDEGWCTYFDFSKGDSVYKRRWANAVTRNYSLDLYINRNLLSNCIEIFDSYKNIVKVKLRKRGILKKIKKTMGTFIKEDTGDNSPVLFIEIKEVNNDISNVFTYDMIRNGEIEKRESLLNSLYNGKKVCLSKINASILAEVET